MSTEATIVVTVVTLGPVLWFVLTYNGLVRGRNACDESWADIDAELKRRYDLIPNLVVAVQGYARHERELFERVAQARATAMANNGSPQSQAGDENVLVRSLRKLMAVVENYPDLKANESFSSLQSELANTEDRIQRSRRFYNANVRDYRNRLESFPSNVVAGNCASRAASSSRSRMSWSARRPR